jgi:hypothetical protein
MCFPLGLWSRCGSTTGTTAAATGNCGGTGIVEGDGKGVFLETRFNLAGYLGQRVEIRWMMEAWVFDGTSSSYFEIGPGWDSTTADDGWWIDDIQVVGTVEQQVTPLADLGASPGGVCLDGSLAAMPPSGCENSIDDNGTVVVLKIQDLDGNILDGTDSVAVSGQSIRISAIDSQLTGGCADGIAEYQFFKHGELVQDWGPKTYFQDAPEGNVIATAGGGGYQAKVRCSTDFGCTSSAGGTISVPVFGGDGGEAFIGILTNPFDPTDGVVYDRLTQETTLSWWTPGNAASDLYRGTIITGGSKGTLISPQEWRLDNDIDTAACFVTNSPGTPVGGGMNGKNFTTGAMSQGVDPDPPLGQATYYLAVGNVRSDLGSMDALGCANPAGENFSWNEVNSCPIAQQDEIYRRVVPPLCN